MSEAVAEIKPKVQRVLVPVKAVFLSDGPSMWGEPRLSSPIKKLITNKLIGISIDLDDKRRELVVSINPTKGYADRPPREICIPVESTNGYELA